MEGVSPPVHTTVTLLTSHVHRLIHTSIYATLLVSHFYPYCSCTFNIILSVFAIKMFLATVDAT